jgi:hypothetical protein
MQDFGYKEKLRYIHHHENLLPKSNTYDKTGERERERKRGGRFPHAFQSSAIHIVLPYNLLPKSR